FRCNYCIYDTSISCNWQEQKTMKFIQCDVLPDQLEKESFYQLAPLQPCETYYNARVDRNIGWITPEEQSMLKHKTVGISGCGGMGGLLAQILLRAGIGHIKIADNSAFDE